MAERERRPIIVWPTFPAHREGASGPLSQRGVTDCARCRRQWTQAPNTCNSCLPKAVLTLSGCGMALYGSPLEPPTTRRTAPPRLLSTVHRPRGSCPRTGSH